MKIITTGHVLLRQNQAPQQIRDLISELTNSSLVALLNQIDKFTSRQKSWPRTDLCAWIPLLNRMDSELQQIADKVEKNGRKFPFLLNANDEQIVVRLLNFTRYLLDHGSNKGIYSSQNLIRFFLHAANTDVVVSSLRVGIKVHLSKEIIADILPLTTIIPPIYANNEPMQLHEFANAKVELPTAWTTMRLGSCDIPITSDGKALPLECRLEEFMTKIRGFEWSAFLQAIWLSKAAAGDAKVRHNLVCIQCLAVGILVIGSDDVETKVLRNSPNIVQSITNIASRQTDESLADDLKLTALDVLQEMLAHFADHQVELSRGIVSRLGNMSVMTVLPSLTKRAQHNEYINEDLTSLLFKVLAFTFGSSTVSAGLVQALLSVASIDVSKTTQSLLLTRTGALVALDSFVRNVPSGITFFDRSNGLERVLTILEHEADPEWLLTLNENPPLYIDVSYLLSHQRVQWIKSLLVLVCNVCNHRRTSSMITKLMNSKILTVCSKIILNSKLFGWLLVSLAFRVITLMLDSERHTIHTLQEQKHLTIILDTLNDLAEESYHYHAPILTFLAALGRYDLGLTIVIDEMRLANFLDSMSRCRLGDGRRVGQAFLALTYSRSELQPYVAKQVVKLAKEILKRLDAMFNDFQNTFYGVWIDREMANGSQLHLPTLLVNETLAMIESLIESRANPEIHKLLLDNDLVCTVLDMVSHPSLPFNYSSCADDALNVAINIIRELTAFEQNNEMIFQEVLKRFIKTSSEASQATNLPELNQPMFEAAGRDASSIIVLVPLVQFTNIERLFFFFLQEAEPRKLLNLFQPELVTPLFHMVRWCCEQLALIPRHLSGSDLIACWPQDCPLPGGQTEFVRKFVPPLEDFERIQSRRAVWQLLANMLDRCMTTITIWAGITCAVSGYRLCRDKCLKVANFLASNIIEHWIKYQFTSPLSLFASKQDTPARLALDILVTRIGWLVKDDENEDSPSPILIVMFKLEGGIMHLCELAHILSKNPPESDAEKLNDRVLSSPLETSFTENMSDQFDICMEGIFELIASFAENIPTFLTMSMDSLLALQSDSDFDVEFFGTEMRIAVTLGMLNFIMDGNSKYLHRPLIFRYFCIVWKTLLDSHNENVISDPHRVSYESLPQNFQGYINIQPNLRIGQGILPDTNTDGKEILDLEDLDTLLSEVRPLLFTVILEYVREMPAEAPAAAQLALSCESQNFDLWSNLSGQLGKANILAYWRMLAIIISDIDFLMKNEIHGLQCLDDVKRICLEEPLDSLLLAPALAILEVFLVRLGKKNASSTIDEIWTVDDSARVLLRFGHELKTDSISENSALTIIAVSRFAIFVCASNPVLTYICLSNGVFANLLRAARLLEGDIFGERLEVCLIVLSRLAFETPATLKKLFVAQINALTYSNYPCANDEFFEKLSDIYCRAPVIFKEALQDSLFIVSQKPEHVEERFIIRDHLSIINRVLEEINEEINFAHKISSDKLKSPFVQIESTKNLLSVVDNDAKDQPLSNHLQHILSEIWSINIWEAIRDGECVHAAKKLAFATDKPRAELEEIATEFRRSWEKERSLANYLLILLRILQDLVRSFDKAKTLLGTKSLIDWIDHLLVEFLSWNDSEINFECCHTRLRYGIIEQVTHLIVLWVGIAEDTEYTENALKDYISRLTLLFTTIRHHLNNGIVGIPKCPVYKRKYSYLHHIIDLCQTLIITENDCWLSISKKPVAANILVESSLISSINEALSYLNWYSPLVQGLKHCYWDFLRQIVETGCNLRDEINDVENGILGVPVDAWEDYSSNVECSDTETGRPGDLFRHSTLGMYEARDGEDSELEDDNNGIDALEDSNEPVEYDNISDDEALSDINDFNDGYDDDYSGGEGCHHEYSGDILDEVLTDVNGLVSEGDFGVLFGVRSPPAISLQLVLGEADDYATQNVASPNLQDNDAEPSILGNAMNTQHLEDTEIGSNTLEEVDESESGSSDETHSILYMDNLSDDVSVYSDGFSGTDGTDAEIYDPCRAHPLLYAMDDRVQRSKRPVIQWLVNQEWCAQNPLLLDQNTLEAERQAVALTEEDIGKVTDVEWNAYGCYKRSRRDFLRKLEIDMSSSRASWSFMYDMFYANGSTPKISLQLLKKSIPQFDVAKFLNSLLSLLQTLRVVNWTEHSEASAATEVSNPNNCLVVQKLLKKFNPKVTGPSLEESLPVFTEIFKSLVEHTVPIPPIYGINSWRFPQKFTGTLAAQTFGQHEISALLLHFYYPLDLDERSRLSSLLLQLIDQIGIVEQIVHGLLYIIETSASNRCEMEAGYCSLISQIWHNSERLRTAEIERTVLPSIQQTSCERVILNVLSLLVRIVERNCVPEVLLGPYSKGKKHFDHGINALFKVLNQPVVAGNSSILERIFRIISKTVQKRPNLNQFEARFEKLRIPADIQERILGVLTSRECTATTFSLCIYVLHRLRQIPNIGRSFGRRLSHKSAQLAGIIVEQFNNARDKNRLSDNSKEFLQDYLEDILRILSPADSTQTSLLRLLTVLDYLCKGTNENDYFVNFVMTTNVVGLTSCLETYLNLCANNDDCLHYAMAVLPLIECLTLIYRHCVREDGQNLEHELVGDLESLVIEFMSKHRHIINELVRSSPKLLRGPFAVLTNDPRVLDFDNKQAYLQRQLAAENESLNRYEMTLSIHRDRVFMDTYEAYLELDTEQLKGALIQIKFEGEDGVDAGGLSREWYSVLSKQIFNSDYALFVPVEAGSTIYQPNRASWVNPNHLQFFEFVGRVIGKAVFDRRLMECYFSRAVYKALVGRHVNLEDMEAVDADYYKSLMWILENDVTDVLTETFSIDVDDYGENRTIELKPGGKNIAVTEDNKEEFVRLIVEHKLVGSVKQQLDHLVQGFREIIPEHMCSLFDEKELELLICGLPRIDLDDWRNNTIYTNYAATSPQIRWFWRAVASFDDDQKARLLQFATGTSRVPVSGFAELESTRGRSKFNIQREFVSPDRLPSSHTCSNQLNLPPYESYEALRSALLKAITEAGTGFGFA